LAPLDFGCGDAQLAKDLSNIKRTQPKQNSKKKSGEEDDEDDDDHDEKLLFKVHSFDLVSPNIFVTACDMSNVPLEDKSVDVCVFCLSLMGTNLADFIREAHRVLKNDGRVKIAEVRSRIEYSFSKKGAPKATTKNNSNNNKNNKNKKESDKSSTKDEKTGGTLDEFIGVLAKLGFECVRTDRTNTMFLLLELKKNGKNPNKKLEFSAKPCIYKRR
jgi:ribosomal RNA-processing protein 8